MQRATYAALAAIVPGLAAATSPADVIVHDNTDGTFLFRGESFVFPSMVDETHLDITQPPAQSGEHGPRTFTHYFKTILTSSDYYHWYFGPSLDSGDPEARFALGDPISTPFGQTYTPPRFFEPGESVGLGETYGTTASIYYRHALGGWTFDLLPLHSYIGVRIGDRYGWVELERITTAPVGWDAIRVLSWAYETEPGVPIIVPAPEGAGLAALACLSLIRRRRPASDARGA